MAKLDIKRGSNDVSVYLFIQDATNQSGDGLRGLAFNTAGLNCFYVRPSGDSTQLSLASQTTTGAHTDGGFAQISTGDMPGVYRLDLSDAIVAAGATNAVVMMKGAHKMAPVLMEIQLVGYDPQDATRLGLTALPNANAGAAGGLLSCAVPNTLPPNSITSTSFTGDAITAAALATSAAQEIRDSVWAKTLAEPSSVLNWTGDAITALNWIAALSRNKITQTTTTFTLRNDNDALTISSAAITNDGVTFTRAEFA